MVNRLLISLTIRRLVTVDYTAKKWYNASMKVKVLRTGAICMGLFIATMIFISLKTEEYPVTATPQQTIVASELHNAVNLERTKLGLSTLTRDRRLDKSAIEKCNDMATRNYWSHNTPEGAEPWIVIKKYTPNYTRAGENEAYGFMDSSQMVEGWMKSPGHKQNIIEPAYNTVGYGVCKSDNFQAQGEQYIAIQHLAQL